LGEVWLSLISGQCFLLDGHYSEEQCFLTLERRARPRARHLIRSRVALLQRILLGQSQKSVAIDFGLAISTVALACSDCLRNMGKNHLSSRAPVLLVMAAHAAHGLGLPLARVQRVLRGSSECWRLSMPRPDRSLPPGLTLAEEAVTRLLVEGHSHARIAELRAASPRTVANQLASAFRKLGISGRAELLANLIQAFAEGDSASSHASTVAWKQGAVARGRTRVRSGARRAGLLVMAAQG
jgi:DNA-binding CsgD family transcriptional regulator